MRLELHADDECEWCEGMGLFTTIVTGATGPRKAIGLCECVNHKPKKGKDDER